MATRHIGGLHPSGQPKSCQEAVHSLQVRVCEHRHALGEGDTWPLRQCHGHFILQNPAMVFVPEE